MKEPQSLCQGHHRVREMGEENGRRKEKSVLWSRDRERRNKICERAGEWILLIKIGEYFHSLKLFGWSDEAARSSFFSVFTKLAHKDKG
jgi:hypothetical protein